MRLWNRDAFVKIGINPNKFQCLVEAMFTRISKGKQLPSVNPLVDLNNLYHLNIHYLWVLMIY